MALSTNWIDKLNQWALRRIAGHTVDSVGADDDGCRLVSSNRCQLIRWSEIQEIAVLKQPPLATGSFAVAIRMANSKVATIDDTASGFTRFCEELPERLQGAIPYENWAVELIAGTPEPGKVIFRRSAQSGPPRVSQTPAAQSGAE